PTVNLLRVAPSTLRLRRPFQTSALRPALRVEKPGLRLIHRVAGILHDQPPGSRVARDRIDGYLPQITVADQVVERLGGLLFVVGILVDYGAQREQIVLEH